MTAAKSPVAIVKNKMQERSAALAITTLEPEANDALTRHRRGRRAFGSRVEERLLLRSYPRVPSWESGRCIPAAYVSYKCIVMEVLRRAGAQGLELQQHGHNVLGFDLIN